MFNFIGLTIQIIFSTLSLCLGWGLILLGLFFIVTSAIGMLRFQGFFNKIHAAGVSDSCGVIILLVGFATIQPSFWIAMKFLILAMFLFFSSPVITHALAKAAFISKVEPELFKFEKNNE